MILCDIGFIWYLLSYRLFTDLVIFLDLFHIYFIPTTVNIDAHAAIIPIAISKPTLINYIETALTIKICSILPPVFIASFKPTDIEVFS